MKKPNACAILAEDVTLQGEFAACGDVVLARAFGHRLQVQGHLTLTPQARVEGFVQAGGLTIQAGASGKFRLQVGKT